MGTSILEVIVKGAPESILAVLCVYFFCKIKPEKVQLAIMWTILMLITFISKITLEGYGMSLLITVAAMVVLFYLVVKIPMARAINGSLLCVLFLIVSEATNFLFIQVFFPDKLELILSDSTTRIIYTIPSTVLLALQVFGVYYFNFLRKNKKDVQNS